MADVLTQLKDAADRGDARAACRVGLELARCEHALRNLTSASEFYNQGVKENASAEQLADRLDSWNDLKQQVAPDMELCEGVASADINEAWSYLLQSATAGNSAAAAYFFNAPPGEPFVDDSEVLDLWAQHLEEFRDIGIRSGDVYTLNAAAVFSAMGRGRGGASRSFPKDPYRAAVYANALIPLEDSKHAAATQSWIAKLNADLPAGQAAAARQEGDALREKYFSNVVTPLSDVNHADRVRAERCEGPQ